jgi:O-methyltransferase
MHWLKRAIKSTANAAGFELRRTAEIAPYVPDIRHAEVFPGATYSPWLSDAAFQEVFEAIRGNTLVDKYRCYELWQLVAEVAKLEAGDFIEIGVWRGGTGALIARRSEMAGLRSTVYLCDTFQGVAKAGALDAAYKGGEHSDTTKAIVMNLCHALKADRVQILEGIFPDDTGGIVQDRMFRFCHIDVDVYQSAKDIVDWIWPRLVPGGVIVYDDYGFHSCSGITRFVNEERLKPDRFVVHNLNGHAITLKMAQGGGACDPGASLA